MKTLDDFTPEIRAKIPQYISAVRDDLYSGVESKNWKREYTVEYIEKVYNIAGRKKPVVVVAKNPAEYIKLFNLLFNESRKDYSKLWKKINSLHKSKNQVVEFYIDKKEAAFEKSLVNTDCDDVIEAEHNYLFLTSEYARVYLSWYYFLHVEFNLPCSKSEELVWLHKHINNASMSRCYFTEECVLVLKMPSKIIRNEVGFHSVTEPAIQFDGGYGAYYLNGRKVPNWVFEDYKAGTLTFDKFNKESNEDIRGSIVTLIKELEGNEGLIKFLDAALVDTKDISHKNGYTETMSLYKTKESYSFLVNSQGEENQPYAWLQMVCPSTGQSYLIDTCPSFTDVIECAKWHRPSQVPSSVPYKWQSAN
jgi:hypothetical protein